MVELPVDKEIGISDISVHDLRFGNTIVGPEDIRKATEEMDRKVINGPIREGLDLDKDHMPALLLAIPVMRRRTPRVWARLMTRLQTRRRNWPDGSDRREKGAGWWG